jgi:ribonuclease HI
LEAIALGLSEAISFLDQHSHTIVLSDSQAALKSLIHSIKQSGQNTIAHILDMLNNIHQTHPDHLVWIPGHEDIEGNEQADILAKQAANSNEQPIITI